MSERQDVNEKRGKSHSHKTAKRLEIKRLMLEKKAAKKKSVPKKSGRRSRAGK